MAPERPASPARPAVCERRRGWRCEDGAAGSCATTAASSAEQSPVTSPEPLRRQAPIAVDRPPVLLDEAVMLVTGDDAPLAASPPSLLQRRWLRGRGASAATPRIDCALVALEAAREGDLLEHRSVAMASYESFEVLGQGTTGVVFSALRKSDLRKVALKVMRISDEELLMMAREEYDILRSLEHPNIVRVQDFFTFSMGAVLVLDWFPSKTLDAAIRDTPKRRATEAIARSLFRKLMEAVCYLHERGIIHRDIKAPNILVSGDLADLRLVDFNTARRVSEGALSWTGTADYMPPEVLFGDSSSEVGDVWSSGLCLHLLLSGSLPLERSLFGTHRDFGRAVVDARREALLRRPKWAGPALSDDCLAVLQRCLEADPELRPTATSILDSPWLSAAAAATQ